MHDVIYTPFDLSAPVKAGRRRFWKQVLPVTSIKYKGQKVDFDPNFHMDLSKSFEKKAFDQVPVVFADGENRHNMDPRNFGGDVLKMEYRGDGPDGGTWALVEADKDAAKAIQKNPRLGVSARIRQMVEKADGRKFPRAIEHLCLTMNPRVTGMGPWQAVDLSEDTEFEVVDLTAINYEEGSTVGTKTATKRQPKSTSRQGKIDLSALDDDQFNTLLDLAQTALADPEDEVEDEDPEDVGEVEDPSPVRRKKRKRSKTKVTVEKDSEEDDPEDEDEEDEEDEDETDLSDADRVSGREALSQVTRVRLDLAEQRWKNERDRYLDAGVPAFLLDLAEPVLSLPDAVTIDLSDEEEVDATDTIRQMLDGVKGIIDLAGEMGHQIDLSGDEEDTETDAFLKAWDEQYG